MSCKTCFCVCVVAGGLFYDEASNISRGTERQGFGSSLLIPWWFLCRLVPIRLFCSLIPMFILTFDSCSKIQICSAQNIKRHNLKIRYWIPWHQDTSVGDTGETILQGPKRWQGLVWAREWVRRSDATCKNGSSEGRNLGR